jgi:L-rhamnose isomerase/sugar isomerase
MNDTVGALDARIAEINQKDIPAHEQDFAHLRGRLRVCGVDVEDILARLGRLRVAVPSWALGTGGTRFGRFTEAGEPGTLYQKIDDVAALDALTKANGEISLHIPWDQPDDPAALRGYLDRRRVACGPINSNTFQDGTLLNDPRASYKFGSVGNVWEEARSRAVDHILQVVTLGDGLGSRALTVWLPDGSNHPGQHDFRGALTRTVDSLARVYAALPDGWSIYTEHKPFEPAFYSSVNPDWGTSLLIARELGPRCRCLVDLGHHLPNANIEQVVAILLRERRLAGFHFNDSKYGDDDLTAGSVKPFQLFLICHELVSAEADGLTADHAPDLMIDASHNIKDPMEDLLQSTEAILVAYAQAMIIDRAALVQAQRANDAALAQEILQDAFRTDLRSMVREVRRRAGGALFPLRAFRALGYRGEAIRQRGMSRATGL